MARTGARKPIGRTRAVVYAVLVHVVIIGLLLLSFRWRSENSALRAPKVIEAHMVNDAAARLAAQKLKQQLAQQELARERQQQRELKQQQRELKQQQQQEQELKQQQQRQQERQQQQELQQQKLARARQLQQQKERKAVLAARLRAAALEKAQRATERKQQEQQEQQAEERRKQRAIASLKRQLAAEEKHREAAAAAAASAAAAAKAQGVIARYKALIRQKIMDDWTQPLDSKKGMKCVIRVKLVQGGAVIEADVVQSSGDPVFDRSAENAVYSASPLPLPDDSTLFPYFQGLNFTFTPKP
ncbi:MAG: cell envelope integrity protein TolA [Acidiferrobacterales bacterium]